MGCLFEKVVVKRQLDYSVVISRYGQRSVPLRITCDRTSFITRCNSAIFAFEGLRSSWATKVIHTDITHDLMECLRFIT
jgi:hypothetical protein